jgi:hypothetical protein
MTGVDGIKRGGSLDTNPVLIHWEKLSRVDFEDIEGGTILRMDIEGDTVVDRYILNRY